MRVFLIAFCVLLFTGTAGKGLAEPLCPDGQLSTGLYSYGNLYRDDGSGIDSDLIALLQQHSGCRFRTHVMPRARIWHDLQNQQLDVTVSGIKTAERLKAAWFIPYMSIKNLAVLSTTLPAEQRTAEGFLDNSDLLFGAVRGFQHGDFHDQWLSKLKAQQRLLYYPDAPTLFYALQQGRIQGLFSQPPIYQHYLAVYQLQPEAAIIDWAPKEDGVPHHLVLSRQRFSEQQAHSLVALLHRLMQQDALKAIFEHYVSAEDAESMLMPQEEMVLY